MDASQLGRFIERIGLREPLGLAAIQISTHNISIFFTNASTSPLRLQISCKQLDWQLSCMAQVCHQFSPFLFRVEELRINTTQAPSGQDGVDGEQWLDLFLAFGSTKDFRMAGDLVTNIMRALSPANGSNATVLPSLHRLCLEGSIAPNEPLWDVWDAFQSSRHLSGHPGELQFTCHICNNSFAQLQEFKPHLAGVHAPPVMCFHCGNFECKPGQRDMCQQYLRNTHKAARDDDPGRATYTPELRRLVDQRTSPRALDLIHTPYHDTST